MKCDRVPFGFGKKETKTMTLKICRLQNRTGQARPGPVWLGLGFHQVGKRCYHGISKEFHPEHEECSSQHFYY